MFNYIKGRLTELEKKGLRFGREEEQYEPTFIFKSEGFSCSIVFRHKYSNNLSDSMLIIGYWTGHFTRSGNVLYTREDAKPKKVLEITYQFALDDKMNNCWIPDNDKNNYYYSNSMADKLIAWLLQQITEKRQKDNNLIR